MQTYPCSKCKQVLSIDHFHKDISYKNRYRHICKKCRAKNRNILEDLLGNAKKRSKKRAFEFNLSREYILELNKIQNGLCKISGIKLNWEIGNGGKQRVCPPDRVSLDRIDSSKGYIIGNVQLVTDFVNRIKCWYPLHDVYSFCELVIRNRPT